MQFMERDQLDLLKRQIEDDYRQDMAAIDRLMRRFAGQTSSPSHFASQPAPQPAMSMLETPVSSSPRLDPMPSAQQDDITGSLRAMFNTVRK